MMKSFVALIGFALLLPITVAAQEDVSRRTYTFLENRLDVAVIAEVPGVLQIVRGERGRVDVAGHSSDGFAGSALGGRLTRQLRLTAVGARTVEFLVVVPEHVALRVQLPDGTSASVTPGTAAASYRWAGTSAAGFPETTYLARSPISLDAPVPPHSSAYPHSGAAITYAPPEPQLLRTAGALFVAHDSDRAPSLIDVPDLSAIRTLDVRFEHGSFRVVASRPLSVRRGDASHFVLQAEGDPLDIVLFIPPGTAPLALYANGSRIAEYDAGRPRALCNNVVIQTPAENRTWLTFHPQSGRIDCRP
jgi:hypothetical protein